MKKRKKLSRRSLRKVRGGKTYWVWINDSQGPHKEPRSTDCTYPDNPPRV